jgi:hypothetical protein
MAAGLRTIKVKFTGDATDLNRAANSSEKSLSRWSGGMQRFGAAAAAAGLAAGVALFQFAKSSVTAFVEAEQAQQRLTDAFTRFPSIADTNITRLRALNMELARKTKFDDDAFASGQSVLAQFDLTGKQLEDLTPLLADFAAKTGRELPDAAETLGKAFLGNTRALKELGIDYKVTGDRAQDVANITELVRKQVGGFAEEQGRTAAGQAAILSNQFGELKEQVGEKLLPALIKLAEIGLKTVDWISQNKEIVGPLVAVIVAVTAAQWLWNIAMTANPVGIIIVAVAALIAIIIYLATKTTFFQDLWRVAWGGIKAAAVAVWDWLKELPGKIGSAFAAIADFISRPFRAAFNLVSDAWNNTIGRLSWTVPGWIPVIGGRTISAPRLPRFHGGGVVPGPFGREVLGILRAGEVVQTARQAAEDETLVARIDLGEGISQVVEIKLKRQRRQLVGRVLAGAGAGR